MNIAKLHNWSVVFKDPYLAPEAQDPCLHGVIVGHSTIDDWTTIITSKIIGCKDNVVITYSGTRYVLMDVDYEYEKLYPGAKERLFASIKNMKRRSKKSKTN